MLSLRERKLSISRRTDGRVVKEGDIVILKEDGSTRAMWKIAKVVETLKGRDGNIRVAKLRLMANDKLPI